MGRELPSQRKGTDYGKSTFKQKYNTTNLKCSKHFKKCVAVHYSQSNTFVREVEASLKGISEDGFLVFYYLSAMFTILKDK